MLRGLITFIFPGSPFTAASHLIILVPSKVIYYQ